MNKILTYSSFVIASTVVIVAFVTATTYLQLAAAILIYPVLIYFAFKAFSRKSVSYPSKKTVTVIEEASVKPVEKVETNNEESTTGGISDINKRAFLKLIGATGISFFLLSIFGRRVETLLFSQNLLPAPASNGNLSPGQTNTPPASATDGYNISEIDDNIVGYYGFINKNGGWFIMKGDTNNGSYRYTKGESNFPINWNNRERLKYDYYDNVFYQN